MKRPRLAHVLRATSRITGGEAVVMLGSQAISGSHGEEDHPTAAAMSVGAGVTYLDDPADASLDLVNMHLGTDGRLHETGTAPTSSTSVQRCSQQAG